MILALLVLTTFTSVKADTINGWQYSSTKKLIVDFNEYSKSTVIVLHASDMRQSDSMVVQYLPTHHAILVVEDENHDEATKMTNSEAFHSIAINAQSLVAD